MGWNHQLDMEAAPWHMKYELLCEPPMHQQVLQNRPTVVELHDPSSGKMMSHRPELISSGDYRIIEY